MSVTQILEEAETVTLLGLPAWQIKTLVLGSGRDPALKIDRA